MNRIGQLHIHNFKFFGKEAPIELNGKHLLLYGENGSGKSTIYWSLYTLFEAPFKNDDGELIKYFEMGHGKEWSLVNIHATEVTPGSGNFDSFIQLTTTPDTTPGNAGVTARFRLAIDDLAIRTRDDAKLVNYASDFIQYKSLQNMHDFLHQDPIDLFRFFVHQTLQHVKFDVKSFITRDGILLEFTNAYDIWREMGKGAEAGDEALAEFDKLVNDFNTGMNKLIDFVKTQSGKFLVRLGYTNFKFTLEYKEAAYIMPDGNFELIPFEIPLTITEYEHKTDVAHRPHSFLNEAKLNAIGISVRLAVLFQKISHAGLKFVVLDDLLISLDMRNREKVLALLLSDDFSKNFQLLILTHDRHFYEMAKREIKEHDQKDEWVYYEMYAKELADRTVPYLRKEDGYLGKALHFFNEFENDIAANFLRKEAESFCKAFLPTRLSLASDGRYKDLSAMLAESIKFAIQNKVDTALIELVNKHREYILNPGSHDSYDVPKFRNELMICHDTLDKLGQIKLLTLLPTNSELHFEVNNGTDTWRVEITMDDELGLLQEVGKGSTLLLGRINYKVSINAAPPAKGAQYSIENIGLMYAKCYAKASNSGIADFWDGIIISKSGNPLRTLKAF